MPNETKRSQDKQIDSKRRQLVGGALLGSLAATTGSIVAADKNPQDKPVHFPGDPPENRVVYQFNHPQADYHDHVVFSIGAMLRQYGDNIKIAMVAFGPGIHVLLKQPRRPVSPTIREKIASLSQYGVDFYACGNTLTSLKLGEQDVVPFAKLVEVGASTLMELQKQGYAYLSW